MSIASLSQVRSLVAALSGKLSHARIYFPSPVWLRRASITERASPHTPQPTNKTIMSTTESLHKQCRTLESLFDNKLTAYSRLAATITRPGSHDLESTGSLERWQDLEVELEELLQKVSTSSVHAVWFLKIPCGRSWERSTTNSIRCRMMPAIK